MSRPGHKTVLQADIRRWQRRIERGDSMGQIARDEGWNKGTISKHLKGKLDADWYLKTPAEREIPPPKRYEELSEDAKRALEDFRYFRNKYFNRATPHFQQYVCDLITELKPEEPLIALWPPGHGKTTTISHDYPMWRMLRARASGQRFACLLLSKSGNMARGFVRRLKQTMEHNKDLQMDFGWFKPEHPDTWTRDQLAVDGFDPEAQGKEPTFIAAGAGSHIYGWRVDLIICDDLVDSENAANVERQEDLERWFHEEVESRLERGGSLAVCGTRFSMHELYGRLMSLRDEEEQQMYRVVTFPAHDSNRCPGQNDEHVEWPDGCLLWPEQKSYKWLMRERTKMGSARFDFVYNQVESSDDANLLRSEWVEASKDTERSLWQIPRGTKLMATLDPSPTNWACAQIWAYDPDNDKRYLVAIHRARMTVSDMISLMEEWTTHVRKRGYHMSWVFEQNAAQRWLFQSLDYKLLVQRTGIQIMQHNTHRNKADPDYGVQSLAPLYEYRKVSIPWQDPDSRKACEFFISELKAYPNGTTDDGVMAQWFFEWNIRRVKNDMVQTYIDDPKVPPYLLERRKMVNL